MTTTVKVEAHCSDDKEVQVSVSDIVSGNVKESFVLQNGETAQRVVYDDLTIAVREVVKS